MADHQLSCRGCGNQFSSTRKRSYCSVSCRQKARRNRIRQAKGQEPRWPDGVPANMIEHECFLCGATFKPKRKGRDRFCSRDCGTAWTGAKAAAHKNGGRVFVTAFRKKPVEAKPAYDPITQASCRNCGRSFDRRDEGATRYMCSQTCWQQADAKVRRTARKRRKAIERGATVAGPVDPIRVFERDGWRCGICGQLTQKSKRGQVHPKAPELDHIVPLSKGGEHTYLNTQCSCRQCNAMKSDSAIGQLRLFG